MLRLTHLLKEQIADNKVICNKCGWKWNITDGGKDTYTCHKCGNDNTPINEGEEPNHNFDRDMVVGVAEILRMVNDMGNRKEIADKMMEKFNSENVTFDETEFLKLSGIE